MKKTVKQFLIQLILAIPAAAMLMPNNRLSLINAFFVLLFAVMVPFYDPVGLISNFRHQNAAEKKKFVLNDLLPAILLDLVIIANLIKKQNMMLLFRAVSAGIAPLWLGVVFGLISLPGLLSFFYGLNDLLDQKFSKKTVWKVVGILALLTYFIQWNQSVYPDIDNYYISLVVNGLYSRSEILCQFISPVISWLSYGLGWLLPFADGFNLLMGLSLIVGFWIVYGAVMEKSSRIAAGWIVFLMMAPMVIIQNTFHMNFSSVGALLICQGSIGICCVLLAKETKRPILLGASLFVLAIGSGMRIESLLMISPYVLLSFIYLIWLKKQSILRSRFHILCLTLSAAALIIPPVLQIGMSLDPKLDDGIRYTSARSDLVDYECYPFDSIEDELNAIQVSANDYQAIRKVNLINTEKYTTAFLEKVSRIAKVKNLPLRFSFGEILRILTSDFQVLYPCFLCALILPMILCICNNRMENLILLGLSVIGSYLILCYFVSVGRIPPRIILIPLFGILMNSGFAYLASKEINEPGHFLSNLLGVVLIAAVLYLSGIIPQDGQFHLLDSWFAKDTSRITDMNRLKTRRVWSVFDQIEDLKKYYISSGKLPDHQYLLTQLSDGGWMLNQPYYEDLLQEADVQNMLRSLADGEYLYVADQERAVQTGIMMKESGLGNYQPQPVDDLQGFTVWKFVAQNE